MVISIHQKDKRTIATPSYIDIGVTILREDDRGGFVFVAATGNTVERQQQLFCTSDSSLRAGRYIVVPTSTGCRVKSNRIAAAASYQLGMKEDRRGDDWIRACVCSFHISHGHYDVQVLLLYCD